MFLSFEVISSVLASKIPNGALIATSQHWPISSECERAIRDETLLCDKWSDHVKNGEKSNELYVPWIATSYYSTIHDRAPSQKQTVKFGFMVPEMISSSMHWISGLVKREWVCLIISFSSFATSFLNGQCSAVPVANRPSSVFTNPEKDSQVMLEQNLVLLRKPVISVELPLSSPWHCRLIGFPGLHLIGLIWSFGFSWTWLIG